MEKIKTSTLGWVGALGGLIASTFLPPKSLSPFTGGLFLAATGVVMYLQTIWVESEPNEWMLVIKNGVLKKAGIGLKTFVFPGETVVRFPSAVQRVEFSAKNVTKEMQGIEITGIAFWGVYREGQGPFDCYKYMQGGDANSSVRTMCESIVRNQMANCTLTEVLTDRNKLRNNLREGLQTQFKKWGIWLETVELTEVTICSKTLFEDLQANFRQDTRLKAQQIRLVTSEKLNELKSISDLKISSAEQNNYTEIQKIQNTEALKKSKEKAIFDQKMREFELRKIEAGKKLTLAEIAGRQSTELLSLDNNQKLEDLRKDYDRQEQRKVLEVDQCHNDVSLQKYEIDASKRVFDNLNMPGLIVNQFVGNTKGTAAIFPGLQFAVTQGKLIQQ